MNQRTYRSNHPQSRKHCSRCKRWRLVIDFSVRQWIDIERTVPLTFSACCKTCDARRQRERTGYKLREWYAHGVPGSEQQREHVRAMNRASAARRRKDPDYRAWEQEYWRIWRNAKNGSVARGSQKEAVTTGPRIDPRAFLTWADGRPLKLTETQTRGMLRLRTIDGEWTGAMTTITFVDGVMTANGAHHLVAILYPFRESQAA